MKKLLFLLLLVMAVPVTIMAEDAVEIDGIYYTLVPKGKVATVTSNPNKYSGDIVIPSTVSYNSVVYNVKEIGTSAFYYCSGLTTVTIPNSVTSIGDIAFYGSGLTSIDIPSSVTSIGYGVFNGCTGLTSIDIPNSVTSIGDIAFKGSGLTSIDIPSSVTSIGYGVFSGCTSLTSITVASGNTKYDSRNNCNAIIETSSNTLINGCINTVIPNSVTSIGESAFSDCTGLISITIPSSVTSIGEKAFFSCTGLTSIDIPDGVTSIGELAFFNCTGLPSIDIPSSVTSIGYGVFQNCTGLTSITIPDGVTSIGQSAFAWCFSLTSIEIPNSVTRIEYRAFYNCTGLTSVDIGSGVTKIESNSFANCENLLVVTCRAISVPSTNTNAFDGSDVRYATLIVPDESVEAYSTNAPWSSFNPILPLSSATMVTANSYTREYGDANPTFGYISGVTLNGELDITCAADATSAPGTYPITISQGTATNTGLIFVDGTLTITKAPLTITANSYTIMEGDALPTFEAEYEGLKNDETEAVLSPVINCAAADSNTPGTYDITVTATTDNYEITYVAGTLTILPTKMEITIGSTGKATYCSAYDLDFSSITDFKACIATGYNSVTGNVIMQIVTDAPAGTGLYLQGTPGTYEVPCGESGSYYMNMLVGTTAPTTIAPVADGFKNLILYNGSNGVGFYTIANNYTVGANKAYLQLPAALLGGSAGANSVGVEFEDTLDGIEDIDMSIANDAVWYSLDGRQLNGKPTQKGMYVVNGRKVVIK